MAITYTQQPGSINFCNNPIIVKAITSLSGKTFLRIVCECTFSVQSSVYTSMQLETSYSAPVQDKGEATFNLSDASQTLINRMVNLYNGDNSFQSISESVYIRCYEIWVLEGKEIKGEYTPVSGNIFILPGGLTDYERMKAPTADISSILGNEAWMTRKPNGGTIYKGETFIMPTFNAEGGSYLSQFSVNGTKVAEKTVYGYEKSLNHTWMVINGEASGPFTFTDKLTNKTMSGYYSTEVKNVKFLRFVNGFGAIENISVKVNEALSYEMDSEESSLVKEASFRPSSRRFNKKTTPVGSYSLSSGYVNRAWAEWFMQEFLPTSSAWMYENGVWIPGTIEPDDTIDIYNRAKEDLLHIDFTFKLAIDGGTTNSFV